MTNRFDVSKYVPRRAFVARLALIGVSLAIGGLSVGVVFLPGWAYEPQLDKDAPLKPLVDTYQPGSGQPGKSSQSNPAAGQPTPEGKPVEGRIEREGMRPVSESPTAEKKPLVLTGKVQTLQQAIESERATVDWYAWYLSAREYLWRTGGLRCSLGTPIKFYRDGKIEALTFDTACISSVLGKRFPLPQHTQLDALILPVRSGQGPPASPQEIYSRIRS